MLTPIRWTRIIQTFCVDLLDIQFLIKHNWSQLLISRFDVPACVSEGDCDAELTSLAWLLILRCVQTRFVFVNIVLNGV